MAEISYDPRQGTGPALGAAPVGTAPSQIDEAKRQKLLELVRGRALARPTDLAEDEVMVWPSLVVVEAVSATVFLGLLTLLSIFVSAPLTERANANATPNPSKAPWYFLNLQELLLHMDAGLAGVIVPSVALGAIAAIPYLDRSPLGVGILGTSAKGRKIAFFTFAFTAAVLSVFIVADEVIGAKRSGWGIGNWLQDQTGSVFISKTIFPSIVMLGTIGFLMVIIQSIFRPTRREMVIALYTGFFAAYWILSIYGTSFRGRGQDLTWPWNLPLTHH